MLSIIRSYSFPGHTSEAIPLSFKVKSVATGCVFPHRYLVLIFIAVVYFQPALATISPLTQFLHGWFWLIRVNSQSGHLPQFSHFMHVTHSGNQALRMSAFSLPGRPMNIGSDINRIRRLRWRTQPECTLFVRQYQDYSQYSVYEEGYELKQVEAQGTPDLSELAQCLMPPSLPHAPLSIDDAHSFAGIINGLLTPAFRRDQMSQIESGGVFTPDLIIGRRLSAHSRYIPDQKPMNHYLYSSHDNAITAHPETIEYKAHQTLSLIQIGATPHIGSFSVFQTGNYFLIMTLGSANELVMLVSHTLALAFNWISGHCSPEKRGCSNPDNWDQDHKDRQTNSFPTGKSR